MIEGIDPEGGLALACELEPGPGRSACRTWPPRPGCKSSTGSSTSAGWTRPNSCSPTWSDEGTSIDRSGGARPGTPARHARRSRGRTSAGAGVLERCRTSTLLPYHDMVEQHVEVLVANGLAEEALDAAVEFMSVLGESDGPSTQAGIACFAYTAIAAARAAGLPYDDELLAKADGLLAQATTTITEQALASWQGTFCLIAQALRADLANDPSVESWRVATDACARIGAGLAMRPRLGLVAALLVAGERDEARTTLPELVADARAMGAAGIVARGDTSRPPAPHPAVGQQVPSRLDVLTAREREVLDVLVTGATNRAIAERLFISEKTVERPRDEPDGEARVRQPRRGRSPGARARAGRLRSLSFVAARRP